MDIMEIIKDPIESIIDLQADIANENISPEQASLKINEIERLLTPDNNHRNPAQSNSLKSLMITFNIYNYSDITIVFNLSGTGSTIIETAGDKSLCGEIEEFLKDDSCFYKELEKIEIGGEYFRLFYETMTIDNSIYTVMSLTQSYNFRSTRFHILCDIIMDYLSTIKQSNNGFFYDLFDYTIIELTKFISLFEDNEPEVFFFRYEYISDFFNRIGLATIIEMSRYIRHKLIELFGHDASIIRLSLSSYVVVTSKQSSTSGVFSKKNRMEFNFKGIVLPFNVIQVPYTAENSIYDIFENVYLLNNYMHKGDIRI